MDVRKSVRFYYGSTIIDAGSRLNDDTSGILVVR